MKTYLFKAMSNDAASIHIFRASAETHEDPLHNPGSLHKHDFIEIIYILRGSATEIVNGESYEVRRGDLLFINYEATHQFITHEPLSYINLCFKPEAITESVLTPENAFAMLQLTAFDEIRRDSDEGIVSFADEERDEIERLLHLMLGEYKQRPPSWRTMMESYMNILFIRILRRIRVVSTAKDEPDIWSELIDYIDQNPGADLSLPTLAKKCFYNPSYFSRVFKERFNITLTEYINRRRIDHAIRLFRETSKTAEEISETVGFSSKSSFYRVFTKITGKSPSEFRTQK